jgi:putative tryptophan/tyrosine transport system substrate-binding protein
VTVSGARAAGRKNPTHRRAVVEPGFDGARTVPAGPASARICGGKKVAFEYRYAEGRVERLPDLAAELVRLNPDLIFAVGAEVAPIASNATRTIPLVVVVGNDPVQAGLVTSLGRPGGNVTGVTLCPTS